MGIEEEMEMIWNSQMLKKIPNPYYMVFSDDGINIIVSSTKYGLLAFSELKKENGNNYLRMIFIPELVRGLVFGKKAIEQLKKSCIRKGIHAIETESENGSQGFFEKMGFVLMENEPDNRMILKF